MTAARWLTTREASRRSGYHPKTLIQFIHVGQLPGRANGASGAGRRYRIREDDLERFMQSGRVAA